MKDLVEYIVKGIVSNPEAVAVDEQNSGGEVLLLLSVDTKDMGIVIGRAGQTIKAIRKLLAVRAMAEGVRVNLQISEPEGYEAPEPTQSELEEKGKISSESDALSEE